jgi:hypothetical protein
VVNERTDARMGLLTGRAPARPVPAAADRRLEPRGCCALARRRFVNVWHPRRARLVRDRPDDGPLNIYSFYGLILVYTIYQVPYAFLLHHCRAAHVDPALRGGVARRRGAVSCRTLRRVTLPAVATGDRRRGAAHGVERVRPRLDSARHRHRARTSTSSPSGSCACCSSSRPDEGVAIGLA